MRILASYDRLWRTILSRWLHSGCAREADTEAPAGTMNRAPRLAKPHFDDAMSRVIWDAGTRVVFT
jgi:hypothetical protein